MNNQAKHIVCSFLIDPSPYLPVNSFIHAALTCCLVRTQGGQVFPRKPPGSTRQTTVDTRTYGPKETATILKKCKAEGVTIAHAVFALVNVAWARKKINPELPLFVFSSRPSHLPSCFSSCVTSFLLASSKLTPYFPPDLFFLQTLPLRTLQHALLSNQPPRCPSTP